MTVAGEQTSDSVRAMPGVAVATPRVPAYGCADDIRWLTEAGKARRLDVACQAL
jgi:hypothetical protein